MQTFSREKKVVKNERKETIGSKQLWQIYREHLEKQKPILNVELYKIAVSFFLFFCFFEIKECSSTKLSKT